MDGPNIRKVVEQLPPRAIIEFEKNLTVKGVYVVSESFETAEKIEALLKKALRKTVEEEPREPS
jgi:hypothetical protein